MRGGLFGRMATYGSRVAVVDGCGGATYEELSDHDPVEGRYGELIRGLQRPLNVLARPEV